MLISTETQIRVPVSVHTHFETDFGVFFHDLFSFWFHRNWRYGTCKLKPNKYRIRYRSMFAFKTGFSSVLTFWQNSIATVIEIPFLETRTKELKTYTKYSSAEEEVFVVESVWFKCRMLCSDDGVHISPHSGKHSVHGNVDLNELKK